MKTERTFNDAIYTLEKCVKDEIFLKKIQNISESIIAANAKDKFTAIFGNGGSAADSQHWAGELVCTYLKKERKTYKAISLTTDTSIITAWANDFNYDEIFKRQIESLGNSLGFCIGLSTSGQSKNVLSGLQRAKEFDARTCLIAGENAKENSFIDLLLKIPSKNTGTIQSVTQVIYHSVCEELEDL